MKVNVKRFGFDSLLQDYRIMKNVVKQGGIFVEIAGEKKVYVKKDS